MASNAPAAKPRPKRPVSAKSTAATKAPGPSTRNGFIHARAQALQKPTAARDHVYGAGKLFTPGDIEQEALQYSQMSREELEVSLRLTRTKLKNVDATNAMLRSELARCENEVTKQQRRLEKFLEPQVRVYDPGMHVSRSIVFLFLHDIFSIQSRFSIRKSGLPLPNTELRRELEKTLLLRQMKTQNTLLRRYAAGRIDFAPLITTFPI